jgi:acyl carrier protein
MAAEAGIGQRLNALGMGLIEPEQGLQILERALIRGETQVAVLPIDWPRFFPVLGAKPSLSEIINEQSWAVPKEMELPPEEPELRRRLNLALPADRRRILSLHIQDLVIKVLCLDPAQAPDPRQPLRELGIDSLMAIEIGNALGRALGRPLSVALIYDHPTIEELAARLANADCIEQGSAKPSPAPQADLLGEILDRLESISEDEAGALIKKAVPKHQSRGEKPR